MITINLVFLQHLGHFSSFKVTSDNLVEHQNHTSSLMIFTPYHWSVWTLLILSCIWKEVLGSWSWINWINSCYNCSSLDLSSGTRKLCIFGNLGIVFILSCFVSCLLLLLFYVSLKPVYTCDFCRCNSMQFLHAKEGTRGKSPKK